jgi:hypothetical protein
VESRANIARHCLFLDRRVRCGGENTRDGAQAWRRDSGGLADEPCCLCDGRCCVFGAFARKPDNRKSTVSQDRVNALFTAVCESNDTGGKTGEERKKSRAVEGLRPDDARRTSFSSLGTRQLSWRREAWGLRDETTHSLVGPARTPSFSLSFSLLRGRFPVSLFSQTAVSEDPDFDERGSPKKPQTNRRSTRKTFLEAADETRRRTFPAASRRLVVKTCACTAFDACPSWLDDVEEGGRGVLG